MRDILIDAYTYTFPILIFNLITNLQILLLPILQMKKCSPYYIVRVRPLTMSLNQTPCHTFLKSFLLTRSDRA